MPHTVDEIRSLLERLPALLDDLSEEVWQNIEHDDPSELQTGVSFKHRYNRRADKLRKSAAAFLELIEDQIVVVEEEDEEKTVLRIKPVQDEADLDQVSEFLSSVQHSESP
jgi:uncharacterized protein (DUF1697 family)